MVIWFKSVDVSLAENKNLLGTGGKGNRIFGRNPPKDVTLFQEERHVKKPSPTSRLYYGWVIVAVAFIVFMISYGLRYSFSIFFPVILQEFNWSRVATAGMFSLHIISYGLISPISGRLADRFGPRRVIPMGAVLMAIGMMACSAASELWQFYLLYGIVVPIGICISGWSQFAPTLVRWFVRRRATALGIASAGFALSFLLSSLTAPLILYLGWRGTFLVLGLLPIIVVAPLGATLVRSGPEDLGVLPDGGKGPDHPRTVRQRSVDWTVSEALKSYRFWLVFTVFFLVWGLGQSTILAHQVAFMHDLGYSEVIGAVVLGLYGVVEVVGNLSSFVADRFRRDLVFVVGSLGLMASIILLMLTGGGESGLWRLYGYSILFGFCNGLVGPVLSAIPADIFQGRNFGGINGLLMLGFGVGGALGPWLGGFLFDISGTYTLVFYMALFSFLLASLLVWLVVKPTPSRPVEVEGKSLR